MKKYLACLILMLIGKNLYSKCGLPANFTFTVYDTAVVFYLTGGSTNASYYYDFGDGTQSQIGKYPKGLSHRYQNNAKYTVTMYYWDPVAVCRDTVQKNICRFILTDFPVIQRNKDTLIAEIKCLPSAKYVWYITPDLYGYKCKNRIKMPEPDFYQIQLVSVLDTPSSCFYSYLPSGVVMDFTNCGFTAKFNPFPEQESVVVYSNPFYNEQKAIKGIEKWYWGDGTYDLFESVESRSLKHNFGSSGTFNVCHVLKDSANSCIDSLCQKIKVDSCVVNVSFDYKVVSDFIKVNGTINGLSWIWYYEDKVFAFNQEDLMIQTVKNGKNKVCLEAVGFSGCKKTVCKEIDVQYCGALNSNGISRWPDQDSCEIVNFSNFHTRYTSYKWDFGDGGTSDLMSDRHQYSKKGNYYVRLYAYDSNAPQCNRSTGFTYYNECDYCKLKCELTLKYNNKADAVTVVNRSRSLRLNTYIHKHKWYFGDGTSSDEVNPTHIYNKSGLYEVKYICTDTQKNCIDSASVYVVIDIGKTPFFLNVDYIPFASGVNDEQISNELYGFPIPFSTHLAIKGSSFSNLTSVKVYNDIGQEIEVSVLVSDGRLNLIFDSTLNSGIYNVLISDGEFNKSLKVVKE